jgi:hypothetical protein
MRKTLFGAVGIVPMLNGALLGCAKVRIATVCQDEGERPA